MTIDALPERARRATRSRKKEPPPLAIGEADANIVACPACARPLDAGTSRCPGCRTRLVAGVRLTKALTFATAGLLVGLIVGTSATGAVALAVRVSETPAVVADPVIPVPSSATIPSAAPASAAPIAGSGIPAGAISAIRQAGDLDQRLAIDGGRLAAALDVSRPSAVELARILRTMNANATVGERVAPQLGAWGAAATLSAELDAFYAEVGKTARGGLAASMTNTKAYVRASKSMLTLLDQLVVLDAAAQPLARRAGVDLAPLQPDAAPAP